MSSAEQIKIATESPGPTPWPISPGIRVDNDATPAALDTVLRRVGLSWAAIEQRASEAVLFGSRAAGLADASSDWDLLLVGEGRAVHTNEIDVIWVASARIWSEHWLGSELANHVAVYGRWLFGSDNWRHRVRVSPEAAARKKAAVQFQLTELIKNWPDLLPGARARHVRRLRRDVQRLHFLCDHLAVPPTQLLDHAWAERWLPQEDPDALFEEVRASRYRV